MPAGFESIKGLGPRRIQALEKAGIHSPEELLLYLPVKYVDYTNVKPIADCVSGEDAVLRVSVYGKPSQAHVNGKTLTRAVLCDETGKIHATWFRQPWMYKQLVDSEEFTVYGRVENKNGVLRLSAPRVVTELRLTPKYKPIDAIPAKLLSDIIKQSLARCVLPETLPAKLRNEYGLMDRNEAVRILHDPIDRPSLEKALYRFRFEDMLCFMVCAFAMKPVNRDGIRVDVCEKDVSDFIGNLPFPLTGAQKRVLDEILTDLRSTKPMARLVQGDVGCGKTAVAFAAIYACAKAGFQCAMMAPTEILAGQHFESAQSLLEKLGVKCALLTGSISQKKHREVLDAVERGEIQAVFGTHALVSPSVKFKNLALAITDEQHRFGVRQRTRLGEKGENPNVLVMSATPIPRTMALILYGDLDISVIDELPPGRIPVKTRLVPENKRGDMYRFIIQQASLGRQAYFVCPLVEDSETVEAESATHLYESMKQSELGKLKLGLIYGKQKAEEKQQVLDAYYRGETDVLVSTTVIEVGVNVPNATVMVVENAERFGLSQLHQLRGRVGRGNGEAWCFLMANATQKLKILTETNDGFKIAERDMELRGPGDLFGTRQTGAIAGLDVRFGEDSSLLALTNNLARKIAESGDEDSAMIRLSAQAWLKTKNDVIFAAN